LNIASLNFTCSHFELGNFSYRAVKVKEIQEMEARALVFWSTETVVGTATTHEEQASAEAALAGAGWKPVMKYSGAHDTNKTITTWMKVIRGKERL